MKNSFFKTLFFVAAMTLGLLSPVNSFAQKNDNFFQAEDGLNRDMESEASITVTHNNFETVPLGSGLAVLVAAGLGYVGFKKRKSLKKYGILTLAAVMLLGFTQCKKKKETTAPAIIEQTINMTLRVDNGKVNITPPNVTFENDDKLYISQGTQNLGTITYDSDKNQFAGVIKSVGEYIQPDKKFRLCLFGGKGFTPVTEGDDLTLDISDQSAKLPMLSLGETNEAYSTGGFVGTASLTAKCALVKFNVVADEYSQNYPVYVKAQFNKAEVPNDALTPITYSKVDSDYIKLAAGSGEKLAVMAPQEAKALTRHRINETYLVTQGAMPELQENKYYADPVEVTVQDLYFSVGGGKKVYFSKGNLWINNSSSNPSWQFEIPQYDTHGFFGEFYYQNYVGDDMSHFGYNPQGHEYYLTAEDNSLYGGDNLGTWVIDGKTWRALDKAEWEALLGRTKTIGGQERTLHGYAKLNETEDYVTYGLILLPDCWDGTGYDFIYFNDDRAYWNELDRTTWSTLETLGAVFLPLGGFHECRNDGYVHITDSGVTYAAYTTGCAAYYWTNSTLDNDKAYVLGASLRMDGPVTRDISVYPGPRFRGCNIRLVRDRE